jgi:hypothetical protein
VCIRPQTVPGSDTTLTQPQALPVVGRSTRTFFFLLTARRVNTLQLPRESLPTVTSGDPPVLRKRRIGSRDFACPTTGNRTLGFPRPDTSGQRGPFLDGQEPRAIATSRPRPYTFGFSSPETRSAEVPMTRKLVTSSTRHFRGQTLRPSTPEIRCPEITLHINHNDSRHARDFHDVGSRVLVPFLANLSTPPTRNADMPDP